MIHAFTCFSFGVFLIRKEGLISPKSSKVCSFTFRASGGGVGFYQSEPFQVLPGLQ